MAIYVPTITVSPTPLVEVTTSDLTPYSEIQETQGTVNYEATSLYYQAETIEQINAPVIVQEYDSTGTRNNYKQINVADPDQVIPVKNIDLKNEPIIFNGRTKIDIELFPQENVKLYFETQQSEPSDFLKGGEKFFDANFLKSYGFFEDYNDEINGEINTMREELDTPKQPIKEVDCDE